MAIETDEERATMLIDFGTTVTKADDSTFTAIFDSEFQAITPIGAEVDYEGKNPILICKTSDVSSLTHGSALIINSTTYNIIGIEPDGRGMTILQLEEQ